jgi:hypothetical protein
MSIIRTALTAATFALVAVSANAQTYTTAPVQKPVIIKQDARSAHGSTVIVKEKAPFSREALEGVTSN